MHTKTVLCFGSEGFEGDDIAFSVCQGLVGYSDDIRFVKCDTPMDILGYAGGTDLYILDAIKGIDEVSLFDSVDGFRRSKSATVHDQDLGLMLKILLEMNMLPDAKIIGIPIGSNAKAATEAVKRILSS